MNNLRSALVTVLLLVFLTVGVAARPLLSIDSILPESSPSVGGVRAGTEIRLCGSEGVIIAILVFTLIAVIVNAIRDGFRSGADTRVIVLPDVRYPDNHHVPGVGYYHAAYGRWYPLPWNEFRDGKGFYYGGEWHGEPAPATTEMTLPDAEQVHEVNLCWRRACPEKMAGIWDDVERNGFGQAVESIESRNRGS